VGLASDLPQCSTALVLFILDLAVLGRGQALCCTEVVLSHCAMDACKHSMVLLAHLNRALSSWDARFWGLTLWPLMILYH
jgi:hypothetical protein